MSGAQCRMVGAASDLLVILAGAAGQCSRLHCLPWAFLLPSPLVRQAGLLLLLSPLLLLLLLLLLPYATVIRS